MQWIKTLQQCYTMETKKVSYLSFECLFGVTAGEILKVRSTYSPPAHHEKNEYPRQVINKIAEGQCLHETLGPSRPIVDPLLEENRYFPLSDQVSVFVIRDNLLMFIETRINRVKSTTPP